MNKNETEAVAQDMSRIYGGRWTTDDSTFIDGYRYETQYVSPDSSHTAAIRRLRWNMGSETHEEDCAHIFSTIDGKITPYSLLDLDIGIPIREFDFLKGTQYEAEAGVILAEVIHRRQKFLHEVKKGELMKRTYNLRFKIIDHWDVIENSHDYSNKEKDTMKNSQKSRPRRKEIRVPLLTYKPEVDHA